MIIKYAIGTGYSHSMRAMVRFLKFRAHRMALGENEIYVAQLYAKGRANGTRAIDAWRICRAILSAQG